jgi:hypothetical protein
LPFDGNYPVTPSSFQRISVSFDIAVPLFLFTSTMTVTSDNPSIAATDAPEPQADQIQYLAPTPPGFAPEYDYFAVVKLVIETAGLPESDSFYQSLSPDELLKGREESSCRASLVNSSGEL